MRYIIILLLLFTGAAYGQSIAPSGAYNTLGVNSGGYQAKRAMIVPKAFQPWTTYDTTGFIWLDTTNHFLYYHNGTSRVQVGAGGGGSGTVTSITAGYGLNGGTITTSGTVLVDTTRIVNRRMLDSVANEIPVDYIDSARLADSVSGRVPYRNADDSVLLGEYPIRAGQFNLDLTPTAPTVVGGMYWDVTNVCPAMPFDATYTHRFGQAIVERARNNTGTTISAGKVVYISGAQGNNPTITMANPDSVNSSRVIGVTVEDIADNATGFVMVTGKLDGINTSGFSTSAPLYLDTITGGLTQSLLPPPHNVVFVGYALNSTINGRIFIRPAEALGSDTTLGNASQQIAPTQEAVKKYVVNTIDDSMAVVRDSLADIRSELNGKGSGTVTSVGSGFGLTGGAITTSGTLRVDTTNVPTQYRVDTTASNALARINTKGSGTVTSIQLVAGTGVTITPTTAVTTSGTYTISATGATGVQSITSTGSTAIITGTTTVNVEVDTTHSFTLTGNNTFTRDITVDSVSIGTGNGLSTNVRFGRNALPSPTTATGSIAIGENTLNKTTTGINNIAIGRNSQANTSVSVNGLVGIGINTLNYSTGDNNTATGTNCMSRSVAWNGIANTGSGANSGNALTSGSSNTWSGAGAANALTSGSSNTFMGVNSGNAITTGSQNSIIGAFTGNSGGLDIRTLSNRVVISDGGANIRAYHTGTNWLIGTVTDGSTGILQLSGSLGLNTAGNKLNIATGTNGSVGTATLVAGTVTVNTTAVTASSVIILTGVSTAAPPCATCGDLSVGTITAGTSFVINSSLATDTRVVNYLILN